VRAERHRSGDRACEGERRRRVPDGNDVDVGIGTWRSSETPAATLSGRARLLASFIGRFTTAELTPIATSPVVAARRRREPASAKSGTAVATHSFECSRMAGGESGEERCGVTPLAQDQRHNTELVSIHSRPAPQTTERGAVRIVGERRA
jgi:hypothetical protein